jgi:hypothetical protein
VQDPNAGAFNERQPGKKGPGVSVTKPRFNATLAERGAGAMPRGLRFGRLSMRPRHPRRDPAARETPKDVADLVKAVIAEWARTTDRTLVAGRTALRALEPLAQSARVGQQGTLTPSERDTASSAIEGGRHEQRRKWVQLRFRQAKPVGMASGVFAAV